MYTTTIQCLSCKKFATITRNRSGSIIWPGGCPCLSGIAFGSSENWKDRPEVAEILSEFSSKVSSMVGIEKSRQMGNQ